MSNDNNKRGKGSKEVVYIEPHELISSNEVELIRKSLISSHANLVVQGMLDKSSRVQLENVVKRDFNSATKGNPAVIAYVVREAIGTGVIEEILGDTSITDIGYNGSELVIETNDNKVIYDTNFEITDDYIVRLVNKFANSNNKEFTSKNPIFDGRFENVRINAVHSENTAPESGTTMSLRVVRPKLVLTDRNFEGFAPMFMYDFFRASAISKQNMVISGTTGTGKTELHKLIASFIPFDDRILLIEDTPETFLKEMFPEKDIYSWVTSENVGVTPLIKAGLRNNPDWIMVTETRGQEAYEMIQAVLSGHSIITSLHAVDARAIPSRFVNMAKMGYELSEEALIDDIKRYFNFGIHIKKVKYEGHVIRYLQEVVEFQPDGDKTIFKQRFLDGIFHFETFELTDEFKYVMEESGIELDFPSNFKSERPLDKSMTTFESTIPLDEDGRPDYAKIAEMGTTLGILMGTERAVYNPLDDNEPLDYNVTKDGYIAPVEKTEEDILKNEAEDKMNELKEKVKKKTTVIRRPEVVEYEPLNVDLQKIIEKVGVIVEPEIKPIKRPVMKKEKKKTVQEILEEKRKLLHDEIL